MLLYRDHCDWKKGNVQTNYAGQYENKKIHIYRLILILEQFIK